MRKILLGLVFSSFAVLGFSLPSNSAKAPEYVIENDTRYIIQTNIRNPYEMGKLTRTLVQQGFDVAGYVWQKGEIEVITNAKGIKKLNAAGLKGSTVAQFLAPDARFLNPATTAKKLQDLHAAYPQHTRLEQIGTSIQGRPVYALLISNTPAKNDAMAVQKPSIIFDGVHHAREVMTAEVVMDIAEELLTKQGSSAAYKKIVDNWLVWVVPMLNVDGSNIVFTNYAMWRKNAHMTNNRVHGVDLNRNYAFKWNACGGSSGATSSETYRGEAAGSEPETKALMSLAEMVRPTASISYHSYSELVLYAYGCNGLRAAEQQLVEGIGKELAALLPSDNGRGTYTPGTPWELLYAVDGASSDHIYGQFGALSYTFEVNQSFQPAYTVRQPTLEKHRKAWSWFFERMSKNLLTISTVNARTGRAESVEIDIDTVVHRNGEMPFKSNAQGKFFKVLDPGAYVITAKTADGRRANMTVEMSGQPKTVTLTIQ
ncbi:MAG: M14 family metallopeptidase [Bdellovibrionales bacterium]